MSPPPSTAIVLIDPYNDFLHPSGKLTSLLADSLAHHNAIKHLQTLVKHAHDNKIPIFYGLHQQVKPGFLAGWTHPTETQVSQKENVAFEERSWGVEIFEGLKPDVEGNGDVVVSKHWCSSSFQNTDLQYQLDQREIKNLVFAGLTANTCVESTARYAYELGYNVTMLKDATAGWTIEATTVATDLIWPLFANRVLTVAEWIESLKKE